MINTRSWRQVVIAALLAGGSFAVSANPTPPPVSYGVEEDVFHPVRAREGMVASVDATATRVGVDILRQGATPSMPRWPWAMRWRLRIHRPVILAAVGL